jgi:outer membrane protein
MTRRIALVFMVLLPGSSAAQQPAPAAPARPQATVTLSLPEALTRARSNSPTYRQVLNDAGPARWAVRNAYANFLPQFDVSGRMAYTGSGSSTFGGSTFNQTSPALSSDYSLNLSLTVSGTTLLAPATEKANQRAVEEDINNGLVTLDNDVTVQYMNTLQAIAQTDVARQQVQRNSEFLELARARFQVGQATLLDVRQAEVTKGRSDLALLVAIQTENEAKLELLRRMGTELPVPVTELTLSDSFPVTEPAFDEAQLLSTALNENPSLRALRAREDASGQQVKAARSQYLPSLQFFAGWSGFTQEFTNTDVLLRGRTENAIVNLESCEFQNALIGALPGGGVPGFPNGGIIGDCRNFVGLDATGENLSPEVRSQLLSRNNVFPWDFQGQPFQAAVRVSIPIFTGFDRNLQVARAAAAREDAEEAVRARRLQVRSDVQARYLGIQSAWQAISVQEANRTAARDQLQLAQERFRLGNGSALEVTDAQTNVAQAEADYVNAVYAYHRAIAALEFAVGRRLR